MYITSSRMRKSGFGLTHYFFALKRRFFTMEQLNQSFWATEKLGKLIRKYALPCILSLLVGALYNIVDQTFIANADYLGSLKWFIHKDFEQHIGQVLSKKQTTKYSIYIKSMEIYKKYLDIILILLTIVWLYNKIIYILWR